MNDKSQQKPSLFHNPCLAVVVLTALVLATSLLSCNQPLVSSGLEAKSVDLGGLFGPLQSRSTNNIESARLFIADSNQVSIFDQTYNQPPPNNQIMVDLVLNKRYFLELTINCLPSGTTQSIPMVYKKSFTMPESGNLDINLDFPGPDDWAIFNPLFDSEIGPKIGWNGAPPTPMSTAFDNASLPGNASLSSNSGTFGDFRWAWTRQGTTVVARITALVDIPLGSSDYVMLKDSYQDLASAPTPGCQEDFRFSGGQIKHVFAVYEGTQNSVISQLLVNDFDYLAFYKSVGPTGRPLVHVSGDTGSDSTGDGTLEKPVASLYRALDMVGGPGPREIRVALSASPYIVNGAFHLPPDTSIVGGFNSTTWVRTGFANITVNPDASGFATGIGVHNTSAMVKIAGLSITINATVNSPMYYGISVNNSPQVAIQDNIININCVSNLASSAQAFGIMVNGPYNGRIERNKINVVTDNPIAASNASAQAINFGSDSATSSTASAPQIYNNVLNARATSTTGSSSAYGLVWYAASATTFNFNPVIRNNTIRTDGTSPTLGAAIGGVGSPGAVVPNLTADNNIMYGSSGCGLRHGVYDPTIVINFNSFKHNIFLTSSVLTDWVKSSAITATDLVTLTAAIAVSTGTNLETAVPSSIFTNEAGMDFSLTPAGYALTATIMMGLNGITEVPAWTFTDDIAAAPRPSTGSWSVGAYK